MKKLILAATLVASVTTIQAATVKWTAGNVYERGSATAKATGYMTYFISAADYSLEKATADLAAGKTDFVTSHGRAPASTSSGAATGTITTSAGNSESWTGYLVIFDASTVESAGYAYLTSTATKATGTNGQQAMLAFTSNTGTQNANNWYAVPEPTSIALLALGLAAVGLKRKVA